MAYSIDVTQQQLIDRLKAKFPQESFETAVPDATTVKRNAQGKVTPYLTYQFFSPRAAGGATFAGAASEDHAVTFYVQAVAGEADVARRLGNKLLMEFTGLRTEYGSEVKTVFGGRVIPVANSDGTGQFFIYPISLGASIQLFDNV